MLKKKRTRTWLSPAPRLLSMTVLAAALALAAGLALAATPTSPDVKDVAAGAEDARLYGAADASIGFSITTACGDVNNDGIQDLVMAQDSGDTYPYPDAYRGRAYLYFGRAGISGDVDLGTGADLVVIGQSWTGGFNSAACGDVNGDGYDDIVLGSAYYDGSGAALVILGRDDYTGISGTWELDSTPPDITATAGVMSESGGMGVACADFDGDGCDDVAWGATLGNGGIHYYDGAEWTTQVGGNLEVLNSISMTGAATGWAVGDYISLYTTIHYFNGSYWTYRDTGFADRGVDLNSVSAYNSTNVWAVGEAGTVIKWGGSAWAEQPSGVATNLNGVWACSDTRAWAVGDGGVIRATADGGATDWTAQASGTTTGLNAVSGTDSTHVWAVGDGGVIRATADGGATDWTAQASGTTADLNAVYALDPTHIWAVGDGGTILFSDGTAGGNWTAQDPGGITENLRGVTATSSTDAWACGENGALLHYTGSWTSTPQDFTNHLNAIDAWDAGHVYEAGDAFTGRAYIAFGSGSLTLPATLPPEVTVNGVDTYDWAGAPLTSGSFDGDAYADLLIGANNADGPGNTREDGGDAYVVGGRASWPPVIDLRTGAGTTIYGADAFDRFPCYAQNPSPDFDRDGTGDLLLSAWFADGPGNAWPSCGEVDVIYGGALPAVFDLASRAPDITFHGGVAGEQFGYGAFALDFNGDQLTDLAASSVALGRPDGRSANGVTCLVNGRETWPSQVNVDTSYGLAVYGAESNDYAGFFVSGANLHNNDSTDFQDLVVSAMADGPDNTRPSCGEHYIFLGYDEVPPTCAMTGLTEGQVVRRTITVGAGAYDYFGVEKVEFYLDGELVLTGTAPPYRWDWDTLEQEDGQVCAVKAVAYDVNGNSSEDARTVTVDNDVAPACAITGIAGGEVLAGGVDVGADAGGFYGIARVEFYLDGTLVLTDTSAPYDWYWDTLDPGPGQGLEDNRDYTVKAVAYDNRGKTAEDGVTVRLNNALPSPSSTWYMAEGSTDWGFEEWVLIQNPGADPVDVEVTFMKEDGTEVPTGIMTLPATSRRTVNVHEYVGPADVSTRVEAGGEVICERAMYWNDRAEGHDSVGTTNPSRTWYLAEGSTDWGFEEWVLIQNPGIEPATVEMEFMKSDGTVVSVDPPLVLDPTSRRTVNVSEYVGAADVSTRVEADRPVIVERAMYRDGRGIGHDTVGTPSLSRTWYLAEGSTNWGFDEWVLIQNPGAVQAAVAVDFMKTDGTVVPYGVIVPANSRYSIHVNEVNGCRDADLSTYIHSDQPVIAERAMYWTGATKQAGHVTLGTPMPVEEWYLAEGTTDWGFETYVLVQNPNPEPCTVTTSFMRSDGTVTSPSFEMAANSRLTVKVNDYVEPGDVSTTVTGTLPVIAERAMYWRERDGGHCTIGAW